MRMLPAVATVPIASLIAGLTAGLIASAPVDAGEVRLNDAEIKEALSGKTAVYTGGDVYQYFDPNGRTPYWDRGNLTQGSWMAQDDRYCSVWPPSTTVSCYMVFRDDDGNIVWADSRNGRWTARMVEGRQIP